VAMELIVCGVWCSRCDQAFNCVWGVVVWGVVIKVWPSILLCVGCGA